MIDEEITVITYCEPVESTIKSCLSCGRKNFCSLADTELEEFFDITDCKQYIKGASTYTRQIKDKEFKKEVLKLIEKYKNSEVAYGK